MEKEEIQEIIQQTVATTVQELKAAGMLKDDGKTDYEKTEELLRQYTQLQKTDSEQARRAVAEIDACLAEAENDPYVDVIRLFYFGGVKNAACAKMLCCEERTCRRNRRKLVERFAARLAAAELLREL